MQIKGLQKHSDLLGMVSAGLCLIHCIALPVFLLSTISAGLVTHEWHWLGGTPLGAVPRRDTPLGGTPLDYIFIALAVLAVYFSAKRTPSSYIRIGMWLSVIIFGVALLAHEISEYAQYISIAASMVLMLLHFINIRHCKRCSVEKIRA